VCRLLEEGTSRSCRFACVAFSVHRYMFGRVLNQGFVNPRVRCSRVRCRRDSLHETLLSSLNRSKGSQRALCGGESLVVRVDGRRSILNAYDAGKEAKTLLSSLDRSKGSQRAPCGGESLIVRVDGHRSILNAYDAGKEAI
jgi:hypothetical protein